MKMIRIIFALLLWFFAAEIQAATYNVKSGSANTNNCTTAQTSTGISTINAALNCIGTTQGAGANQIVEVFAGTYVEFVGANPGVAYLMPSGTSWNAPFTLRAHGSLPSTVPGTTAGGDVVTIKNSSSLNMQFAAAFPYYTIVQGFVFDGTNLSQENDQISLGDSSNGAAFVRVQNNELINNVRTHGIFVGAQNSGDEILHNKIHGGGFNCSGSVGGSFCYPVYLRGNNQIIDGNELYDFPSYGLHLNNNTGLAESNAKVRNNVIHNFNGPPSPGGGWGIIVIGITGSQVYNNVIYNAPAGGGSVGGGGIALWSGCDACIAYENTVYNAAYKGLTTTNATNAIVKNNIDYLNGASTLDGSNTTADHNLTTNPSFVSTTPGSENFRLQSSSTAKDAGADLCAPASSCQYSVDITGATRPQGSAWDIGAYEFQTAVTPFTVNIQSTNPTSGCSVTVSPTDNNGANNGTTPFTRVWNSGTTITLTAAANCGGNNFSTWSGVTSQSGAAGTIASLANDLTASANYVTPGNPNRTLTVTSNPSGVPVACNGSNKLTPYTVTVPDGTALTCLANHTVSGPVARWNLTTGSGTTETDQSGNGNTITFTNTSWVGTDLTFNGSTSYGATAASQLLNVVGDFAIAATATPSTTLTNYTGIAVQNFTAFLYGSGNDQGCGSARPFGGFNKPSTVAVCHSTALTSGVLTKLIITRNAGVLTFYKDGASVGTPVTDASGIVNGGGGNPLDGVFTVGRTEFTDFWPGVIANVRYYGRGFSTGDVTAYGAGTLSDGNNFASWQGCTSGSGATCNVTMTQDRTLTAQYPSAAVTAPSLIVGVSP